MTTCGTLNSWRTLPSQPRLTYKEAIREGLGQRGTFERKDPRKCFKCGRMGMWKTDSWGDWSKRSEDDFASSEGQEFRPRIRDTRQWIKSSLGDDLRLLDNVEDYTSECLAADGGTLHITKRWTAIKTTSEIGKATRVQLPNAQYAAHLERRIVSYGLLEAKGYAISYR